MLKLPNGTNCRGLAISNRGGKQNFYVTVQQMEVPQVFLSISWAEREKALNGLCSRLAKPLL